MKKLKVGPIALAAVFATTVYSFAADHVVVMIVPEINTAPFYVAQAKGYFEQEGLELEVKRGSSGQEASAYLASGQIDVGSFGLAAGIFNGFHRGFNMRIVATAAMWPPEHSVVILGSAIARKSGAVTKLADLKDKRIAIAGGGGSGGSWLADCALRNVGLSIKDVKMVNIPGADMPLALKNGQVDAMLTSVPFSTQAVAEGWGDILAQNFCPGAANTQYFYSGNFITKRPAVAERFMVALVKGARDIQDSKFRSKEIEDILSKATGVKVEYIRAAKQMIYSPDMVVRTASIEDQEKFHREMGYTEYKENIPLDKMIDNSFRKKAVDKLGPYKK